jgi:ubiquinone/menaquinone biosynthesis C-methylase UbiE
MAGKPSTSPNAREAQYWNSSASKPWAERYERIDKLFADLTQAALDLAAAQPGERVIDIGCGSGTTVLELARQVGPGGFVLGADISKQLVEKARERIAAANLRHAEVVLSDVSTHVFAPKSFDLAFSRFGVMFFPDPIAAFTNLRKAMKPGGRLAFAVFRTPKENPWSTGPAAAVRHLLPPATPPGPEEPGMFSWADPARVHRILEGAGFQNVSLKPHDAVMRLAGPGGAAEAAEFAIRFGPMARAESTGSLKQPEAVQSALQAFFQSLDGPRGIALPRAAWLVGARA